MNIVTAANTFTTPNLRGSDGADSDISAEYIENLIQETTSGAKIAQNEEGKWGYIPAGADTVIPFKSNDTNSGITLPINGVICFGGSQITSYNGLKEYYFYNWLNTPIQLSEITEIKTITTISNWYNVRNNNSSGNMLRFFKPTVYFEQDNGTRYRYTSSEYAINSNLTTILKVTNKEIIINKTVVSSKYTKLVGIGCYIGINSGGAYYFETSIGGDYNTNRMEYIIS